MVELSINSLCDKNTELFTVYPTALDNSQYQETVSTAQRVLTYTHVHRGTHIYFIYLISVHPVSLV